ncbi:MAG: zinc ribbon domain-containing protein [Asgard group archaeon]|nr:zinc ribbon domain-containing protein [Asgard group archaeon]
MNYVVIAVTIFSSLIFILIQIRFIRRFLRIRRNYENLPGVLFLAEAIGEGCFDCCAAATEDVIRPDYSSDEHLTKYSGKPPEEHEVKLALDEKRKAVKSYQSVEEEQNKVFEIISKRQKTGILYISNLSSLPKERIVEILADNPDFAIEDEFVINKKLLEKEELKSKELKEIKEKMAQGFCPKCNFSLEPEWDFCGNCGYILKTHKKT